MRETTVKVAAGVLLVAALGAGIQSLRLHAQREAEWEAKLDAVLHELHALRDQWRQDRAFLTEKTTDRQTSLASEALTQRVTENTKSLDLVHDDLRALRGLIEQARLLPGVGYQEPAELEDPAVTREEAKLRREITRESRKRKAIANFRAEPVDPDWVDSMDSAIAGIVSNDGARGISIPEYECRSSSCEMYWSVDAGLSDFEKFERDNFILAEMAKLGLKSVVYLDAPSAGEYRAIFAPPRDR